MSRKTKIKLLRVIIYTMYVIIEFIALAMLACQYRNLISIAIILIWVMMTLIICYVNLIEVKEED